MSRPRRKQDDGGHDSHRGFLDDLDRDKKKRRKKSRADDGDLDLDKIW